MSVPSMAAPTDQRGLPAAQLPTPPLNAVAIRGQLVVIILIILAGTYLRARDIVRYSLWIDEAWVGLTSHARTLSDFLLGLSSTPVLFALVVRVAQSFLSQPELGARFVPFCCSVLVLPLAFQLGKKLQGTLAGLIALCLIAFDPVFIGYAKQLKQFSTDGVFALAIVWLGLDFLAVFRKRNAVALALFASLAPGFSHPALFLNLALVLTLGLRAVRGPSRDIRAIVLASAPIVLSSLAFLQFDQRFLNPSLLAYWQNLYLPAQPIDAMYLAYSRTIQILSSNETLGLVLLLAALVGITWSAVRRGPGPIGLVGFAAVGAIVAAIAGRYPFGDPRTSLYLTSLLLTAAGAGWGYVFSTINRRFSWHLSAAGLVIFTAWWGASIPWRTLGAPSQIEETSPLIHFLEAHRQPDDIVVIYYSSAFAFAYYSPETWTLEPTGSNTEGFLPRFDDPRIVILANHRGENSKYGVDVHTLVDRSKPHRIWLLMSHVYRDEQAYLTNAFSQMARIDAEQHEPNATLLSISTLSK